MALLSGSKAFQCWSIYCRRISHLACVCKNGNTLCTGDFLTNKPTKMITFASMQYTYIYFYCNASMIHVIQHYSKVYEKLQGPQSTLRVLYMPNCTDNIRYVPAPPRWLSWKPFWSYTSFINKVSFEHIHQDIKQQFETHNSVQKIHCVLFSLVSACLNLPELSSLRS